MSTNKSQIATLEVTHTHTQTIAKEKGCMYIFVFSFDELRGNICIKKKAFKINKLSKKKQTNKNAFFFD
jgi:hypothetical protein